MWITTGTVSVGPLGIGGGAIRCRYAPSCSHASARVAQTSANTAAGTASRRMALRIGSQERCEDVVRVEHAGRCVQIAHDVVVGRTVVRIVEGKPLPERDTNVALRHVVGADGSDGRHA